MNAHDLKRPVNGEAAKRIERLLAVEARCIEAAEAQTEIKSFVGARERLDTAAAARRAVTAIEYLPVVTPNA